MNPPMSFAPLAGRLAAHAAKIRPADGARLDVAMIMALFVCALLEMLICVCEALDAQAAAQALAAVVAPASPDIAIPAPRAGRQAPSSEKRTPRLALVPDVHAMIPSRADAPSRTSGRRTGTLPRLAWSRDPAPIRTGLSSPWRTGRETHEKRACTPFIAHAYIVTMS